MSRRLLRTVLLLTALCTPFAACGSDDKRPVIIATFPAQGAVLPGVISEIEVTYDENVTILNPDDAFVSAAGFLIPVRIEQRIGVPCCIYLRPAFGFTFFANQLHIVDIRQGAVINAEEHYALERSGFSFTTGDPSDFATGSAGAVTMLDYETLAGVGTTAISEGAPASHTPVGITGVELPLIGRRFFVQNQNAVAPAVSPLHFFSPGDASTTAVALTDGPDLRCEADTLILNRDGAAVLAAFTHLPTQQIRLYAVDIVTGAQLGFLVLSPPADAANAPLGIDIDFYGLFAYVTCRDGGDGRLVYVSLTDLTAMTEQDRVAGTPGTQGAPLLPGLGAGPILQIIDRAVIADPASTDTTFVNTINDTLGLGPSPGAVGVNVGLLRTPSSAVMVQMLSGYAGGVGLVQRLAVNNFLDPRGVIISDLVGAVPSGATGVVAGVRLATPGSRFLVILDSDVATTWFFDGLSMLQEDRDTVEAGIQGTDISGDVTGVTAVGVANGIYPP